MSAADSYIYFSAGDRRVDALLGALVGAFEAAFPGRVRAYYLEGSYADHTAVATSDIDLVVVFKESFGGEAEREAARQLGERCARQSIFELDLEILDEARIAQGTFPTLKLSSTLLYGADMRDQMPLMPLADWTRERMHAAYWLMITRFRRPTPVREPLDFPQPDEEFYGYLERLMRLPDGPEVRCTRDLIRVTGWAATAMLAHRAGIYVVRKRDCHALYRQHIGDEWSDLLREIYERCKVGWHYHIPEQASARRQLQALCARTLAFENHFLRICKAFLLDELQGTDAAARRDARWLLGNLPYADAAIEHALAAAGSDQ